MRGITFDGYEGEHLSCPEINLWYDYEDRAKPSPETGIPVVATVSHGSVGQLVRQEGEGCLVRAEIDGRAVEGWVRFFFIKELKGTWQAQRLAKRVD